MEGLRHEIEASLRRSHDLMMEERYRLKKPLNIFTSRKAAKDAAKYGSVSALSTSAIYGELRPPAPYAMFGSTALRHRSRAAVYPWETFIQIGEPIYEDVANQEPAMPLVVVPCTCQKHLHGGSLRSFKCPACSRCRKSNKQLHPLGEEVQPRSRRSKNTMVRKLDKNPFSSVSSRKSILECDVSAYDMIKKHLRESDNLDSDLDDNLSDNEVNTEVSRLSKRYGHRAVEPPVVLPEPDYDRDEEDTAESDVSYDATRFKDLRISYSPPPARKVPATVGSLWPDDSSPVPASNGTRQSPDLRPILKRKQIQQNKKRVTFLARSDDSLILEEIDNTPYPEEWEQLSSSAKTSHREEKEQVLTATEQKNAGTSSAAECRSCDTVTRGKPPAADDGVECVGSQSHQGVITCTFATPRQEDSSLTDPTSTDTQSKCEDTVHVQEEETTSNKATVYIPFTGTEVVQDEEQKELYQDTRQEHIYEELPDLTNNNNNIYNETIREDDEQTETPKKSFFEGASKAEILNYLEDAKERVLPEDLLQEIEEEDEDEEEEEQEQVADKEALRNKRNRISNISNSSSESGEHSSQDEGAMDSLKSRSSVEVERNDSGVGAETSKPQRRPAPGLRKGDEVCADCDQQLEAAEGSFCPLVCKKCEKKRSERKDIVTEIVDTELKYGRDLRIIREEFYRPMEVAGLLGKDQLHAIFLNLEELVKVNIEFSEKLQDAIEIAAEQGDEDYTTVNIGKLFLESSTMLHTFETYCVRQGFASVQLHNLEKEKELLRIFLRVSQMENTLMRRMNLSAFLMVPVQRVTKYPLLLSRLYKVTPYHHQDREALREAQQKIEIHLEHINQQTKGVGGTRIWRRISNISTSHRRQSHLEDIGSIKLRKMALEVLKWSRDEVRFVMAGKMQCAHTSDFPWNKKGRAVKFLPIHALLVTLGKPNGNYRPENADENLVMFPRNTGIRDASLLLIKEKNGRLLQFRSPLHLASCVISCESDDVFEVHEYNVKEAFLFKSEDVQETKEWLRLLRYHAKDLGRWRQRRNALANIMINGMVRH